MLVAERAGELVAEPGVFLGERLAAPEDGGEPAAQGGVACRWSAVRVLAGPRAASRSLRT